MFFRFFININFLVIFLDFVVVDFLGSLFYDFLNIFLVSEPFGTMYHHMFKKQHTFHYKFL